MTKKKKKKVFKLLGSTRIRKQEHLIKGKTRNKINLNNEGRKKKKKKKAKLRRLIKRIIFFFILGGGGEKKRECYRVFFVGCA